MVSYQCLGKGHTVHGCTATDQQAEALRQESLKNIMATSTCSCSCRGALWVSSWQFHGWRSRHAGCL